MPRARLATFDPATGRYTGQRAANDPWLDALMQSGRAFWATRNVQLPEQIALDVSEDLSGPDTDGTPGRVVARGWSVKDNGEARIALDAGFVDRQLRRARSQRRATGERRAALRELASKLIHEQGHVGDVAHTEGDEAGFMGAYGAGDLVPQEVARTVRRLVKRRPGEKPNGLRYGVG
jgi:hypothetical protein